MKKALVIFLTLAVAGGLFAQSGLNWGGEVNTGAFIRFGDAYDDPTVYASNDDDDGTPIAASLTGTYDGGFWGLKVTTKAVVTDAGAGFNLPNGYGWMKFFDKMLDVKAGLIDDGVWSTGGVIDTGVATGKGIRLEVTPISGLNIGAFFSYPDAGLKADKIADFFQETAFGFSFDGGIFDVSAAMKLYSEATSTIEKYELDEMDARLIAGLGIHAVSIVDIYIGALIDNLIGEPDPYIELGQNFDFNLGGALGASLELKEVLCDGLQEVDITPEVTFGLGNGLGVGASLPLVMSTAGRNDGKDDLGFASLGLNAWVEKAIGGASMKAGYGFTMGMSDYSDDLNHYIKLVFGYSF